MPDEAVASNTGTNLYSWFIFNRWLEITDKTTHATDSQMMSIH